MSDTTRPTPQNVKRGHSQQKLRNLTVAEKLNLQSIRTAPVHRYTSETPKG